MKRSEMIEKIKSALKSYEDPGFDEELEDDADAFLSMIESAGMRPPEYRTPPNYLYPYGMPKNEWEQE